MAGIKTLAELITPDERTLRFTPLGLSTGETLKPEYAAEFQQQVIAHCDLHPDVAEGTRDGFERLRTLHSYGIFCYEVFTVADDLAWLLMEQAFRERFMTHFDGKIPFVNTKTGDEVSVTAQDFDEVYHAVTRGGSLAKKVWRLKLRSTDVSMEFRGSLPHLQEWARLEGLLHGQRNKRLEPVYRRMRNAVAHPHYHLKGPPDSARTIHDLAEMINRLWGHATPGGRLYPAPLEREVLVIAWSNDELGLMRQMRQDQLAGFNEPGSWTCLVIRGVSIDDEFWEFDAQFERTNFPADLLWGPGSPADALAWLNDDQPSGDTVEYLDRLFALRIHDGKLSLARRPEIAIALPPDRRVGEWHVIRADFPNDAFAHVRHIKDGVSCRDPDPLQGCAVEDVLTGDWQSMVVQLGEWFKITEPAKLVDARVPPEWGVAPDVEVE